MNWKPHNKDLTERTDDWAFSIHHTAQGFTAWQRQPYFKRIGDLYSTAQTAKDACERHERVTA